MYVLDVPRRQPSSPVATHCQTLPLVATCYHPSLPVSTRCHLLSPIVTRYYLSSPAAIRCHSLPHFPPTPSLHFRPHPPQCAARWMRRKSWYNRGINSFNNSYLLNQSFDFILVSTKSFSGYVLIRVQTLLFIALLVWISIVTIDSVTNRYFQLYFYN